MVRVYSITERIVDEERLTQPNLTEVKRFADDKELFFGLLHMPLLDSFPWNLDIGQETYKDLHDGFDALQAEATLGISNVLRVGLKSKTVSHQNVSLGLLNKCTHSRAELASESGLVCQPVAILW